MDPKPWRDYDPVVEAYKQRYRLNPDPEKFRLTVTERFQNAMVLARFADELRRAGKEARQRP